MIASMETVSTTESAKRIFAGKRALIVGGSGGLGGAVSAVLARAGAELFVSTGHNDAHTKRLYAIAATAGVPCHTAYVPLDDPDAVSALFWLCGEPDIVVVAWGPFLRRPLAETTVDNWRRIVTANLILPGALVSGVLGGMLNRHWGRILLFGGTNTANIRGFTTTAPYSAAKTALGVLAKSVAKNVALAGVDGVTCNVICPGLVLTEYMDEAAVRYNRENAPAGRLLTSEEVGEFALGILANSALSGGVYPIDCGVEVYRV
jgi:NAD(P)-dependent dehydrogenase (short-subunit alcohol dehydrogenase family)